MARQARYKSTTGIYHIILRGINKQDIFLDTQDNFKFMKELKRTKTKYRYEIYSYCLMPNHVHLQLKDETDCLSKVMQSIEISYSTYFNLKYERIGHLFQNRYLSKPVETKEYLLDLQRYIHQNPERAKICKMEEYPWSSYHEYLKDEGITDKRVILDIFGETLPQAIENFKLYNQQKRQNINIVEYEILHRLTDEQVAQILREKLQIKNLQKIQMYKKDYRDKILVKIKEIKDVPYTQLARVLGVNRKIIKDILK